MGKDFEVEGKVSLEAGDMSGVEALQGFRKTAADTEAELARIKQSGALSAFGVGIEAVAAAEAQLQSMTTQAALLEKQLVAAKLELAGMDQASPKFEEQANKVAQLTKRFIDLNQAISDVPENLTGYDAAFSRASERGAVYGDLESSGRAAAGLIGAVGGAGGQQIAGAVGVAAEAAALAEALPRLEAGFAELGKRGKDLFNTFKEGAEGADGIGSAVSGGLAAMTAGVTPFIAVAGVAAVALAGLVAIMKILSDQAAKAREDEKATINLILNENEARAEAKRLLEEGNTTELRSRAEIAKQQRELTQENLSDLVARRDVFTQQIEKLSANDGIGLNDLAQFNILKAREGELNEQITTLRQDKLIPLMQQENILFESLPDAADIEGLNQALQDQFALIERRGQLDRQVSELVANASSQQVASRIEQIAREKDLLQSQIDGYREFAGQSKEAYDKTVELQGQIGALAEEEAVLSNTVAPLVKLREQEITAINATIAGLDQQVQRQIETTRLLRDGSSEDINKRLQGLEQERAAINGILPELTKLAATSDEAKEALQRYQERLSDMGGEQSMLENALPDIQLREQQQALAEMGEAEIESNAKILEIRQQGQEALIDAEGKFSKRMIDLGLARDKAIAASQTKENKSLADAQAAFFKDSKTRSIDFYTEMAEREQGYKDSILKIRDDLNNQLTQAERANDVVAYIQAQEAAAAQLTQLSTGFEKENQQRVEQFQAETIQRQAELEERLSQIRTQATTEREEQQARYLEARAQANTQFEEEKTRLQQQTQTRIAGEEDALQKRLSSIAEKYQQEAALVAEFMKQRRKSLTEETEAMKAGDKDRADSRIDQEKRIGEEGQKVAREVTNQKARLETEAARTVARDMQSAFTVTITAIRQQLQILASEAGQLLAQARAAAAARNTSSGGGIDSRNPLANRNQPTAYANEGLVGVADGPRLGMIGEDLLPGQYEAIFKFKPSEGLPGGKLGGDTIYDFSGMTIGAGMSRNEVEDALRSLAGAIVQGISKQRKSS